MMCTGSRNQEKGLHSVLWSMSTKLRGLGEIFVMCNGEIPMSEQAFTGFGHLLEEFADELDWVQDGTSNQTVLYNEPSDEDDEESDETEAKEDPTADGSAFSLMMREFTSFLHDRREKREAAEAPTSDEATEIKNQETKNGKTEEGE